MYKKHLFALLCILVLACQKDNDPTVEEAKKNCRLTKIIQGVHNGAADDTTSMFYYDNSGQLSNFTQSGSASNWDFPMKYDAQHRLIKIEGPWETEFAYNNKGLLSEVQYVRFARPEKMVFEYGADTVPSYAMEYVFDNGQWLEEGKSQYTYQNGNIVTVEWFLGGVSKWKRNYEYYTNLPNALKMLSLLDMHYIGFGSYEPFLYFNKNLLKKADRKDDGFFIDYKIDSGKVLKSVSTWLSASNNDTGMVETRFFYYDCK